MNLSNPVDTETHVAAKLIHLRAVFLNSTISLYRKQNEMYLKLQYSLQGIDGICDFWRLTAVCDFTLLGILHANTLWLSRQIQNSFWTCWRWNTVGTYRKMRLRSWLALTEPWGVRCHSNLASSSASGRLNSSRTLAVTLTCEFFFSPFK